MCLGILTNENKKSSALNRPNNSMYLSKDNMSFLPFLFSWQGGVRNLILGEYLFLQCSPFWALIAHIGATT